MAFVLKQSTSYTWPIPLVIPVDGGRKETHTFDGEFRRLPQSRINELLTLARNVELGKADPDEMEDIQTAKEMLIGWSGVLDDAGKEVPFSDLALSQLLDLPGIAGQIVKAFFKSIQSEKEPGKAKNFKP
jgi:hypothetical protein